MLLNIKSLLTRFFLLCLALVILGASTDARAARDIAYAKTKVAGVHINLITTNLNNTNMFVTPALSKRGIGSSESFRSMLKRTRPAAAINGTFFCTRTLKPTGDIVIDGQLMWKGFLGTAITVDSSGQIQFLPTGHGNAYKWSDYAQVLAAGPTLVLRGKTIVMPRTEGFRSRVHFSRRARAAVGLTYNNKLVFVTTRQHIYYRQLATVMKRLKCVDAAVLDGGSSIGLYYKGKLINNPGRAMTNCLLIYDNRDAYEQHKALLYPINLVAELPTFK
ncbi:MAG: phosphodiester glycosidase family protein [Armatimonadetes bacterium]|nr:phosphodiester glycosidase family protein [Armatimonadota bacterium]